MSLVSYVLKMSRYIGSLGSSQHLHTSVSILLALAQDSASPVVQCWAAHSLGLIADSGGPMFRDFVEVRQCSYYSLNIIRLVSSFSQLYPVS